MTLTATPGAADADSYADMTYLDAYHADRGYAAWAAATETAREQAARRATAWIDGRYGARFPGARTNGRDQALEWPRASAADRNGALIPDDEIPAEVKRALAEAALREVETAGSLSPDIIPITTSGGAVKRTRKKLGPMETETEYTEGGTIGVSRPVFPVIDDILAHLLTGGAGMVMLLRA